MLRRRNEREENYESFVSPKLQGKERNGRIQKVDEMTSGFHNIPSNQIVTSPLHQPIEIQRSIAGDSYGRTGIDNSKYYYTMKPSTGKYCIENRRPSFHSSSLLNLSITDADKLQAEMYNRNPMARRYGDINDIDVAMGRHQSNSRHYPSHFGPPPPHHHHHHHGDDYDYDTNINRNDWLQLDGIPSSTSALTGRMNRNTTSPLGEAGGVYSRTNQIGASTGHVDALKKMADDIIKEKDIIINRNKMRIEELESQVNSSSSSSSSSMFSSLLVDKERLLRDLQHENQSLRDQLANLDSRSNLNISSAASLDKQLCALEYELSRLKKTSTREIASKDELIAELNRNFNNKKLDSLELENKLNERDEELKMLQEELEKHRVYMGGLPSVEENINNIKKIEELKGSLHKSEKVNQERSTKLKERSKVIESRDKEILSLKEQLENVKKEFEEVCSTNELLNEEVNKSVDLQEMRNLKETNEKMRRGVDTNKKVYDVKMKQLQTKLCEIERERNEMKETTMNDERTVCALKKDIADKEEQIGVLKDRVKEVTGENENLHDEIDRMRSERKYYEGMKSEQECRLFKQLMSEFISAFEELKIIIRICKEKGQGKEPDLDDLLGTKSSKEDKYDEDALVTSEEMMERKLKQVKELRKDVDYLRGELADLVAEDLGRRLTCAVQ